MLRRLLFCVLTLAVLTAPAFAGSQDDLFTGCLQCDLAQVEAAVAAGADVKALHSSGQNALSLSVLCPEVTKYLIEKGVSPNEGNYPSLISASNNYSVEVVKMLLDAGADPAKPSSTSVYPLHITVMQTNCTPCLKMMLDAGADVNMKDSAGSTPIQVLCDFSMSREMRRELFGKAVSAIEGYGMKVPEWYGNMPDERNGTSVDMLDLLLAKGADVNAPNAAGYTPLVMALKGGKNDLALALLQAGADPKINSEVKLGPKKVTYNPINLAAEKGTLEIVKLMVEKGVDIDFDASSAAMTSFDGTWGGDGYTPLIIAISKDNYDIAHYLIDQGASLKIGTNGFAMLKDKKHGLNCLASVSEKTPVYYAVEGADLSLVKKIADKMVWKFNPKYTIRQWGGGEQKSTGFNTAVKCKQDFIKGSKIWPSKWADRMGWDEASKYLTDKGL